jgi:hypothetical protein
MCNKLRALLLALAVLGTACVRVSAGDPNGERPGLNEPPKQNLRDPVTVPDAGSSIMLLGAACLALGTFQLIRKAFAS